MSKKVQLDRTAAKHWPPENCVDCEKPTKFWVKGYKYPLCPKCAKKPNAGHGAKAYLKRMGQA